MLARIMIAISVTSAVAASCRSTKTSEKTDLHDIGLVNSSPSSLNAMVIYAILSSTSCVSLCRNSSTSTHVYGEGYAC